MWSARNQSPAIAPSPDPAGVRKDLEDLKEILQVLQKQIEQVEARESLWASEKVLVRDWKDVSLDAADVLDECEYEQLRDNAEGGSPNTAGDLHLESRIANQIRKVKKRLEDVNAHHAALGMIRGEGSGRWGSHPVGGAPSSSFPAKDHVYKDALVDWLVGECAKKDLTVFPIVGLALAGKSALASAIFNDSKVEELFSPRLWGSFGTTFDPEALLRVVHETLTEKRCHLQQLDSIVTTLRRDLKGKRLLLVLDGLHLQHLEVWDHLKGSLSSSCSKGSVVLVTTRDGNVADKVRTIEDPPTLYLELAIPDDECWSLFERYASGGKHPVEEDLREKVVKQCKGLPLAAKLLGISFRHYPGGRIDWAAECMEKVIKENIRPPLKSSHRQLAAHLKPCLLYSSLLPEGHQFTKEQLVRLWMAQGLVDPPPKIKKRPEDVGLLYFDELVKGAVIVQDPDDCTQYSIPKPIRDPPKNISGEEGYVIREDKCDPPWTYRRLLLNPEDRSFKLDRASFFNSPGLRSLLFMPRFKLPLKIQDQDLSSLKRLRTLDLSNTSVSELPESVGGLKHLRFLALNHTGIKNLPESVSKLYNLQVLELKNCYWLEKLPSGVGNLVNLRYLDRGDDLPRVNMPKEIQRLTNLQSLAGLDLQKDDKSFCGLRELKDLNKLTELRISGLCNLTDSADAKEASVQAKRSLQILKLRWCCDDADAAAKAQQFRGMDYERFYSLQGKTDAEGDQTAHKGQPAVEENPSAWNPGDYSDTLSGVADEDEDTNFTESPLEEDASGYRSTAGRDAGEQLLEALKPYNSVEELELRGYPGLEFPGWIGDPSFNKLFSVVLEDCACEELPALGQLPLLKALSIQGMPVKAIGSLFCTGPGNMAAAAAFPKLVNLTFYKMREWKIWDGVKDADFPMLEKLILFNCPKLRTLPNSGSGFRSLQVLDIDRCWALSEIPGLPSLTSLELCRCDSLTSIPSLGSLSSLTVVDCRSLESLPSLEKLENLWVEECERLKFIAGSSFLHPSSKLLVAHCGQLQFSEEQLPYIGSLRSQGAQVFGQWKED